MKDFDTNKPPQDLRRARVASIILGLAATLSIVFFIYAVQQKSRADQLQIEVDALKQQLETKTSLVDSVHVK